MDHDPDETIPTAWVAPLSSEMPTTLGQAKSGWLEVGSTSVSRSSFDEQYRLKVHEGLSASPVNELLDLPDAQEKEAALEIGTNNETPDNAKDNPPTSEAPTIPPYSRPREAVIWIAIFYIDLVAELDRTFIHVIM